MSKRKQHSKSRFRRRNIHQSMSGVDKPIVDPACIYLVMPCVAAPGQRGPTADELSAFIRYSFEPWLMKQGVVCKGLALKIKRNIPELMRKDLEQLRDQIAGIRNQYKEKQLTLFGWSVRVSVGRVSDDGEAIKVLDADEPASHPGRETPREGFGEQRPSSVN